MKQKRGFKIILAIAVIVVIVIVGFVVTSAKREKLAPVITSDLTDINIGRNHEIEFKFAEEGQGLQMARVIFEQNGNETVLFLKEYPKGSGVMAEAVKIKLDPAQMKIAEGPASFRVLAKDHSSRGNRVELVQDVVVDLRPPVISPVSSQHNIRQGGTGLVAYRLNKSVRKTGVWLGDEFFPAYSGYLADDPNFYLCFIALGNEASKDTTVRIEAVDRATNRSETTVYSYVKPHKYKHDTIEISDGFLRKVVPPFYPEVTADTPISEILEKYIYVNSQMRVDNDAKLAEITAVSEQLMYWEGAFLRLPNSAPRAGFGDKRDYKYKGQVVDQQTHLGADLASLAMSPVPAANRGKVAFTGDLGIYGQTVVLDHGFGLFSLYAHMSGISVVEGDIVEKGETLGRTGTTGLAVGDHLHFSMLVNGRFVEPIEWWDTKWINDNILNKLPQ